jgi:hypothetical protein
MRYIRDLQMLYKRWNKGGKTEKLAGKHAGHKQDGGEMLLRNVDV